VDMTSSNFAQTIIGEATQDCVNKLADILKEQSASMKKTASETPKRTMIESASLCRRKRITSASASETALDGWLVARLGASRAPTELTRGYDTHVL